MLAPFMFCRDPDNEVFRAPTPCVEAVRRPAVRCDAATVPLQSEIDRPIRAARPEKWSVEPCIRTSGHPSGSRSAGTSRRSVSADDAPKKNFRLLIHHRFSRRKG
jgi:hypothetical protein